MFPSSQNACRQHNKETQTILSNLLIGKIARFSSSEAKKLDMDGGVGNFNTTWEDLGMRVPCGRWLI